MQGAEFGGIQPLNSTGQLAKYGDTAQSFLILSGAGGDINYGLIREVPSSIGAYRIGQQIWFQLTIFQNPENSANWLTRLRLKPWWLCENIEFRAPGVPSWLGVDQAAFSGGTRTNNRYCWSPSPKRLDITPYNSAPPAIPVLSNSDSVFLDDVWTFDLEDPNDPAYAATVLTGQLPVRTASFYYPSHGVAIGFTYEATWDSTPGEGDDVRILLRWKTGTTNSLVQESIG